MELLTLVVPADQDVAEAGDEKLKRLPGHLRHENHRLPAGLESFVGGRIPATAAASRGDLCTNESVVYSWNAEDLCEQMS